MPWPSTSGFDASSPYRWPAAVRRPPSLSANIVTGIMIEGAARVIFAVGTDERGLASAVERCRLGLRTGIPLFPWEIAEDELREIAATATDREHR